MNMPTDVLWLLVLNWQLVDCHTVVPSLCKCVCVYASLPKITLIIRAQDVYEVEQSVRMFLLQLIIKVSWRYIIVKRDVQPYYCQIAEEFNLEENIFHTVLDNDNENNVPFYCTSAVPSMRHLDHPFPCFLLCHLNPCSFLLCSLSTRMFSASRMSCTGLYRTDSYMHIWLCVIVTRLWSWNSKTSDDKISGGLQIYHTAPWDL